MTVKGKAAATVASAALVAGAVYAFQGANKPADDERKVVFAATVTRGHAFISYTDSHGTHHDEMGSSYGKKKWQPASWSHTSNVMVGTPVNVIVTADEITPTTCAIKAVGVAARPPAVSPKDGVSNTVECTAVIK